MDIIAELKEIIVGLKLDLVKANIPSGNCPYAYYTPTTHRDRDCDDCSACRRQFLQDMEKDIRDEVEKHCSELQGRT